MPTLCLTNPNGENRYIHTLKIPNKLGAKHIDHVRTVREQETAAIWAYARNLIMVLASKGQPFSVSACENITSSVNFLFSEKAILSK